jgi:hypothetical protein
LIFGEQFAQLQISFKEAFSIPIPNGTRTT